MNRSFGHRASIVLNVILAATVAALMLRHSERAPAPAAVKSDLRIEVSPAKVKTETSALARDPKPARYTDIATESDRRRWIVDQLRAAGVPNKILAHVVLSDLEELHDRRLEASGGEADAMASMQLEYELGKDAEMRAALGDEGFPL